MRFIKRKNNLDIFIIVEILINLKNMKKVIRILGFDDYEFVNLINF